MFDWGFHLLATLFWEGYHRIYQLSLEYKQSCHLNSTFLVLEIVFGFGSTSNRRLRSLNYYTTTDGSLNHIWFYQEKDYSENIWLIKETEGKYWQNWGTFICKLQTSSFDLQLLLIDRRPPSSTNFTRILIETSVLDQFFNNSILVNLFRSKGTANDKIV